MLPFISVAEQKVERGMIKDVGSRLHSLNKHKTNSPPRTPLSDTTTALLVSCPSSRDELNDKYAVLLSLPTATLQFTTKTLTIRFLSNAS